MKAVVGFENTVERTKQKQPRLTFKQWMLKTVKLQKKRTNADSVMGLIITALLFLIALV